MRANKTANQVRIIGGSWRGRKITFAPSPGLRPTPDRMRETLFNWLSPALRDARCLDLYAGSGALGLEAASRGAASVVLVDSAAEVVRVLREQAVRLNAVQVETVQADALRWLHEDHGQFDIVFLDPPFRERHLPAAIAALDEGDWLTDPAWVYVEAEKDLQLDLPGGWSVYREKRAGQVACRLIRYSAMS